MIETISGRVKALKKDRKGFSLEETGEWYSRNFGDALDVYDGDTVRFDYEPTGQWKNIKGKVEILEKSERRMEKEMPSITGTVVSMRRDKLGFKLDNGNWYENMQAPPMEHVPWKSTVTFDYDSGGGKNFISGEVKVEGSTPSADNSSGGGSTYRKPYGGGGGSKWHAYQDKDWQQGVNERITKQNALTNAVNNLGPGAPAEEVIAVAEQFAGWVNGK